MQDSTLLNEEECIGAEARKWFRHQIQATIYFMVTKEERCLDSKQAHLEGKLHDVSEKGFKFDSSGQPLEIGEQISFEIVSAEKTVFSGVAEVVHGNNEMIYGMRYIKILKH